MKRKKDEVIVEKVNIGDFVVDVGDKLKVYYHEKKVTYEAKVIEITLQRGIPMYMVHYTGWNNRYDEWVPRERIAENLTKLCKQEKGSNANNNANETDKSKENPPKPPVSAGNMPTNVSNTMAMQVSTDGALNSTNIMAAVNKAVSLVSKRGRGRSEPGSSGNRTKSSLSTGTKHTRPIRAGSRRVSDISIVTESETDSDEPIKSEPIRTKKDTVYKSITEFDSKNNSSIETGDDADDADDDDDDDEENNARKRNLRSEETDEKSHLAKANVQKGRDYDLKEIRSELKGFQRIKTPSPVSMHSESTTSFNNTGKMQNEIHEQNFKPIVVTAAGSNCGVIETELKSNKIEISLKSSTEISSETESYGDDDSQSSDKTTQLENMTKKFQQKISANKQRLLAKPMVSGNTNLNIEKQKNITKTRIVEKILKDSLAEKRQESVKIKANMNDENRVIKTEVETTNNETVKIKDVEAVAEETKTPNNMLSEYTSVIVDKPINISKQIDNISTIKKIAEKQNSETQPLLTSASMNKDLVKIESSLAITTNLSTFSATTAQLSASAAAVTSARSLPDVSKFDNTDISTSTTSSFKEMKFSTSSNVNLSPISIKTNSPDIYEFKDTEPFEFEIRKPALIAASSSNTVHTSPYIATSSAMSSNIYGAQISTRRQSYKPCPAAATADSATTSISALNFAGTTLLGRKKRGSPLKDSTFEKTRQIKAEEKSSSSSSSTTTTTTTTSVVESKPTLNTVSTTTSTIATKSPNKMTSAMQNIPVSQTLTNIAKPMTEKSMTSTNTVNTSTNAFDALRKSPSFNLINALNEELAQTVQETTRALTDVVIPTTLASIETTPTKVPAIDMLPLSKTSASDVNLSNDQKSLSTLASIKSSPPNAVSTVTSSPFIESFKDLSNVFEICASETTNANNDSRDSKFGLEKAKILLSATAGGGFDLEPAPAPEHKPASIADKVLKAISQKKEEIKNMEHKKENDVLIKEQNTTKNSQTNLTDNIRNEEETADGKELLATSLAKICKNEVPTTFTANATTFPSVARKILPTTPLNNLETKVTLLETIASKNTDLNVTIQKLECAIQRKTTSSFTTTTAQPVACENISTVVSSLTKGHFSEDSIDSTDSERRLVIEDIADELNCEVQKAAVTTQQQQNQKDRCKIDDKLLQLVEENINATTFGTKSLLSNKLDMDTVGASTKILEDRENDITNVTTAFTDVQKSIDSKVSIINALPLALAEAQTSVVTTMTNSSVTKTKTPSSTTAQLSPHPPQLLRLASSGFYLDARTELRAEDGVKPISTQATSTFTDTDHHKEESEQLVLGSTNTTTSADVHNESINLLCEETIPGSPAPAVCKDEPAAAPATAQQSDTDFKLIDMAEKAAQEKHVVTSTISHFKQQHSLQHSSPNDSASQDDSSEETKKPLNDEDTSPRKRKRTRQTSERDAQTQDGAQKRRRTITQKKQAPGNMFIIYIF